MQEKKTAPAVQKEQIEILTNVASSAFVLYMKTYGVHWNYHGPKFFSIHKLTDEQYRDQAEAVDEIAERIRALGGTAPLSLNSILEDSSIKELSGPNTRPDEMLRSLISSHHKFSAECLAAAKKLEEMDDKFSHDMVVARIGAHDKFAWMLHSHLE